MKLINKLKLLSLLLLTIFSWSLKAQTIQVGSGGGSSSYFPNYYNYNFSYTQTIYTAAEIVAAGAAAQPGTITKIRYKSTSAASTADWKNWTVYMGNTTQSGFSSWSDWTPTSAMTNVFSGDLPIATTVANGWMEVTLTTPFPWDGTSNIIIAIDENTPTYGNSPNWAGYTLAPTSGNKGIYFYSDGVNPDPDAPPTTTALYDYTGAVNNVAQIQFDGVLTPPCTGTPSAGTVPATAGVCSGTSYTLVATGATTGFNGLVGQWEYRTPSGSGTWQTLTGATTSTYTVTSMPAVPTDYRYKLTCGSNTGTSNTLTTTINPANQCYCVPAATNSSYYIDSFLTTGGSTNIMNGGSGYSTGGYGDFTSQTVTQSLGSLVGFHAKYGSGTNTFGTKVWVDWNQDGDFDDADETVFATSAYLNAQDGSFVVPSTATPGTTRMRVGISYTPATGPATPCMTTLSGEYEDYSFVVVVPTCWVPTNLTNTVTSATTATINWVAPTTIPATGYEYYQSTTNSIPATTATATGAVAAGILTKDLTLLTPNTTYYVWVRSVCSATDKSSWSIGTSFTTPCVTAIAPWTDDVEGQAGTGNNNTISPCWVALPNSTSAYSWNVTVNGTTPSSSTGPSAAHSGTKYFFTEASNGSTSAVAELTTPPVDIAPLTIPALEFYYHMYGSTMGNLYIEVSNGTTWTVVDSIKGQQQTATTDPWAKKRIILTGYTGTIQVKFRAIRGSDFYGDMAIDDISLKEAPTCIEPSGLTATNVLSSTATISWTASVTIPSGGYEYYQNTTNTAPTTTTTATGSVAAGILTKDLISLTANTTYYVWVRSVCSASDKSDWTSFVSFTTPCAAYLAPFTEDLDGGVLPSCWYNTTTPGQTSAYALWKFTGASDYNTTPTLNGRAAGTYAWVDASTPNLGLHEVTLTTPMIDISSLTTGYIEFDWFKNNQMVGSAPLSNNKLTVDVNDGTGWTNLWSDTSNSPVWRTVGLPLPASFSGATIQVRFVVDKDAFGVGDFYDDLLLDNVKVKEAPLPCSGTPDAGIVSTSVSTICAGIGFDLIGAQTNELGLTYQWQEAPTGTTTWTDIAGANTAPYTLSSGAIVESDYRLIVTCTNSNSSDTSNVVTVNLNPALQCYCTPTYSYGCSDDDAIDAVILPGDNAPGINNLNTPCSASGYTDYTSMSADLTAGNTYSGNVTTLYDYESENVRVWIDYNQNGAFEASETIGTLTSISNTSTGDFSFTVPANTLGGTYRMRVRLVYNTPPLTIDPCINYSYGETQDYTVTIVPSCTSPVVNLGNDTSFCSGNTLTLDAGNAGMDFLWSDNSTNQTLDVATAGTYTVTVTDGSCATTDTIEVGIDPLPSASGIQAVNMGDCSFTFSAENAENVTGYNWNFGDGSPNQTGATANHPYDENGSYVAVLTMTNACGTTTINSTVVCEGVGIKSLDVDQTALRLYPNPAKETVTIENSSKYKMENIVIFNVLGQVVYQSDAINGQKHLINVSKFISGLYTVRIKTNGGFIIRKFEILK